jgi:hypothetical protein
MGMSLEEMYKLALNPKIYPTDRLLKIMQGQDTSLPMAVAMSAKQMRDKQTTALKGAQAKAQGVKPSVRDQMVAQGMQQEMAGLDQLPAPTMEGIGDVAMGAGGGLVSFAKGGFNSEDDEDAEQDDHDELTAMAARYGDLGGLGAGIMSVASPKAAKYSSFSLKMPNTGEATGVKEIIAAKAVEHKLPSELLDRIAYAESGHKLNAKNNLSSAKGLFGFTNDSWKGMGGTENNRFDPETNAELGAKLVRQNAEGLKKALKRDPTYGEVYASHHFGLSGAKNLLQKDPNMPMVKAVSSEVIKANPYLKDKTVGQVMATLNKKMGSGIVSLAGGGIVGLKGGSKEPVKGDDEGYFLPPIEAEDTEMGRDIQLLKTRAKNVGVDIKKATKDIGSGITGYFGKSAPGTYNEQPPQLRTPIAAPPAAAPTDINAPGAGATPPAGPMTPPPAAVNPFASSQKRVDDYLAGLTQQRKQDQGISAILTGLTTAGTAGPLTSALKTGAQTGLGYYGDAQKGYNAAMAQGLGAQSALDRNRVYQEMYGNKLDRSEGLKYDTMIAGLDKVAEDRIKNMTKFGNFDLNKPDQRQKAINQIKYEMINANPNLKKHYLESTGLDELGFKKAFNPGLLSDTPVGTVRTLPKQ